MQEVEVLLCSGVNVHAMRPGGITALHLAAAASEVASLPVLCKFAIAPTFTRPHDRLSIRPCTAMA